MKAKTFARQMDNIRKGAINATATVLSAPSVLKSRISQASGNADFKALKTANGYKGAPDFDNGVPTDAFKARSVADGVKRKMLKKQK